MNGVKIRVHWSRDWGPYFGKSLRNPPAKTLYSGIKTSDFLKRISKKVARDSQSKEDGRSTLTVISKAACGASSTKDKNVWLAYCGVFIAASVVWCPAAAKSDLYGSLEKV